MSVADLRRDYTRAGLSEADAGDDPVRLFRRLVRRRPAGRRARAERHDPGHGHAGRPARRPASCSSRRSTTAGFTLLHQLRQPQGPGAGRLTPAPPCVFFWHQLERQVRVEGRSSPPTADAESDEYFASRPLGSRLGAWASPQSDVIPDREYLEGRCRPTLEARFPDGDVPRPPHWGGYRVVPERSSSGRAGRAGCTTASASAARGPAVAGAPRPMTAWRPYPPAGCPPSAVRRISDRSDAPQGQA